ncbi:unnamed protein product, partial [marine sediment metagenome]
TRWLQSTKSANSASATESALAALFLSWFDPELASDIIRPFFDNQSDEGIIPQMIRPVTTSRFPATPFLPEAVYHLSRLTETPGLPALLEKMQKFSDWLILHKKEDDGLYVHGDPKWFAADAYLYQTRQASPISRSATYDVRSVALNSMLIYQMRFISRLARSLKLDREADKFEETAKQLSDNMANILWDEESGFFYDRIGGRLQRSVLLAGFMPLAAEIPTRAQAARMLEQLPQARDQLTVMNYCPALAPAVGIIV